MSEQNAREEGTITRWIKDRGFGFIMSQGENKESFAHITDFVSGATPTEGMAVSYEQGTDRRGRSKSCHIEIIKSETDSLLKGEDIILNERTSEVTNDTEK